MEGGGWNKVWTERGKEGEGGGRSDCLMKGWGCTIKWKDVGQKKLEKREEWGGEEEMIV